MRLTTARCAAYAAALLVLARSAGPAGAQGERALLDAVVDAPAGRAVSQCFAVEPGEVAATVRVVDAYERGVQPIMFGMGMAGDPELARVLSMVPTVEVTFRMPTEAGEACYWLYNALAVPAEAMPGLEQQVAITLTWRPGG